MKAFIGKVPPWVLLIVSLAFAMEVSKASNGPLQPNINSTASQTLYIALRR